MLIFLLILIICLTVIIGSKKKINEQPTNSVKKESSFRNQTNQFEKAFFSRLGKTPVSFVCTKLSVGSDKGEVEYLYDIMAAEIARNNNCTPTPFETIYRQALEQLEKEKQLNSAKKHKQNITQKVKICQREYLNNADGRPFGGQYTCQMDLLYGDTDLCNKIEQIGKIYSNIEFCDNAYAPEFLEFKRKILPQKMKEYGIIDHKIVKSICDRVIRDGKSEKSALITIYYAIRSFTLKMSTNTF